MDLESQFIARIATLHCMATDLDPSLEDLLITPNSRLRKMILINVEDVKAKYLKQKNFQHVLEFSTFPASNVINVMLAYILVLIVRAPGMGKSCVSNAFLKKDHSQEKLEKMRKVI
jgi:hypothetical protein